MSKPEPPQGHWVFIPNPQPEQRPKRRFPTFLLLLGLGLIFQSFLHWNALEVIQRTLFNTIHTTQQQP